MVEMTIFIIKIGINQIKTLTLTSHFGNLLA